MLPGLTSFNHAERSCLCEEPSLLPPFLSRRKGLSLVVLLSVVLFVFGTIIRVPQRKEIWRSRKIGPSGNSRRDVGHIHSLHISASQNLELSDRGLFSSLLLSL